MFIVTYKVSMSVTAYCSSLSYYNYENLDIIHHNTFDKCSYLTCSTAFVFLTV